MKKTLKKIIAREGLILLGFGLVYAIGFLVADLIQLEIAGLILAAIGAIGYPLYLLIRFIIWAIKTLTEK